MITIPSLAHDLNKQHYIPPFFADNQRLEKIQSLFPIIDHIYKTYAEKQHFPGYAFGIMLDGQLIYTGSNGYMNVCEKIPFTSCGIFRIASITKSFTAMAILQLRDAGKLKFR